jgi:hypothetical protein
MDELKDPILLNSALEFASEWGENFRKPILERMQQRHTELLEADILDLEMEAKRAESFIVGLAEREFAGEIGEGDIVPMAREKFPWIKDDHLYRLKNIGMFWARK